MKAIKFSEALRIIKPEYVYLRLKPSNRIRNNNTHKLARVIGSLYKNVFESVRMEDERVIHVLGQRLSVPVSMSYSLPAKVGYFIYLEKQKVEFYFIIPRQHLGLMKEKMGDSWQGVTIEEVFELPEFESGTAKYHLSYKKEDALSLTVDRRNNDWLNSSLNIIEALEDGDRAGILFNLMPTSQFSWRSTYKATIDKVRRGMPVDRNKAGIGYLLRMAVSMLAGIAGEVSELIGGERKAASENPFDGLLLRLNGAERLALAQNKRQQQQYLIHK